MSEFYVFIVNMGWNEFILFYLSNLVFLLDRWFFYSGYKMDLFWYVFNVINQGFFCYLQIILMNNVVISVKYMKYFNQFLVDCLCSFFIKLGNVLGGVNL